MSSQLTAHITKQALEAEQLADAIEQQVVDPMTIAPALQMLLISTRRLVDTVEN